MDPDRDVQTMTAENRTLIAQVLERLDDDQWRAASLCRGWTVRHVAGHLLQPMLVGFTRFFRTSLRYRGDTDRTVDHLARQLGRRPPSELVVVLREHADDVVTPPRVGPWGPFAETCIHLRDIARPLGLDADVPLGHWVRLLDYLASSRAAPALVPRERLRGLRLVATDVDWSRGVGEVATGPAEALAMAACGRQVALEQLRGPGLDLLSRRLGRVSPA